MEKKDDLELSPSIEKKILHGTFLEDEVKEALDVMNINYNTRILLGPRDRNMKGGFDQHYANYLTPAEITQPVCYIYDKYEKFGLVLKFCLRDEYKQLASNPDRVYVLTYFQSHPNHRISDSESDDGDIDSFFAIKNDLKNAIVGYFKSKDVKCEKYEDLPLCLRVIMPPCANALRKSSDDNDSYYTLNDPYGDKKFIIYLICNLDPVVKLCQ